jgi:guanylate kinase
MLFVISAPSGAGKTTIIRELFKIFPNLKFSISATTRKKRERETDGKDYHFITLDEFKTRKENGEFVETEEVHGNYYGTLKKETEPYINSDSHLVFDVDVKGALTIKKLYPEAVSIFIDVPVEGLIRRLKNRNTETEEDIQKRASRIKLEVEMKSQFDHVIDNSKGLSSAVKAAEEIINKYNKK